VIALAREKKPTPGEQLIAKGVCFSIVGGSDVRENQDRGPARSLATFAAAARNKGAKPADQGDSSPASEAAGPPGNLDAEEKDAADIMGDNVTGDIKRVDAAIGHHAKTDQQAG
jgi:hypothetical protein